MKLKSAHLVFALALVAALLGGARLLFGWGQPEAPRPRAPLSGGVYGGEVPAIAPASFARWKAPVAQSAGREWIFEVFTPPIIFFDPQSGQFTLRPPLEPEVPPVFGLEVTGIERVPYRLQYAGHHGEPGRYWVELHDVAEDRFYRGRSGEAFPEGEFVLRRFTAETRRVQPPDRPWATPYVETFIEVVVDDQRSGETVTFGRDPLYLPEPVAVVVDALTGDVSRLFPGDPLDSLEARFILEAIDRTAGTATVAKYALGGALLERRTFSLEPLSADPAP